VVKKTFGARVSADIHYLHHDFAHYLTLPAYDDLISFEHHPTGLGEWFFRGVAFPDAPDNSEAYFQRYYPQHTARNRTIKEFVLHKRVGLEAHFQEMIDRYGLDRVDLVGFTSMFSQNAATLAMARMIKARNPGVVVVVGGANCEAPMGRELLDNAPVLDFVFSGPSLRSFPELVRCLMEGDTAGCHRIDGVFSRRNRVQEAGGCSTGTLVSLGDVPAVRAFGHENDINELVEFDYEPFLDRYDAAFPGRERPILLFETSRGCWWGERAHCTFCGLNGSTISYRSMRPEAAFTVFNGLFEHAHRIRELQSVDNILPKSYLTDVLPYLDVPPNLLMFYEVKADLSEDDFRVLAKARVLRIQPGIEALNTSTLKLMRKGTSVFQNLGFLMNAVRYEILPAWNLLIGFPGEEIEIYEKYYRDLPLFTHLHPPAGVFPVRFDRFSPYFEEAREYGLDLHPLDWYEFTYPFPAESLARFAYYFADRNYEAQYATNAARMLSRLRERVERWKTLWDEGPRPELRMEVRGGTAWIFDSRSGAPLEYPVDAEGRQVLEALSTAKKVGALQKELPGTDVEGQLAALMERGLVFHEGERYLSLIVAPPEPFSILMEALDLAAAAV
jgi:ribosomal peptide maturation radical SAM protein 1